MLRPALRLSLVAALTAGGVSAQQGASGYTIPGTRVVDLASESVGASFQLHVALPGEGDPPEGLPLVVLLDSNEDFPLVTAIARRLQGSGALPPFLLVGVGYPEYPQYFRSRDYTPSEGDRPDRPSGGAAEFLHFLSSELVPWIEGEYRTSDHRVLLGHSLGGLMGVYSVARAPSLFTAVVASSPSVWWGDEEVLDGFSRGDTRIYTSLGGEETALMTSSWRRFVEILEVESDGTPGRFHHEVFAGEGHSSVKPMAFSRGLRWVFGPGGRGPA